jgi:pimeloyl-ACP methyl ester carboxylesterase
MRGVAPIIREVIMATFVLVHGGWHGGWCWARVVDKLRPAHAVYAPTLAGLAERADLANEDVDLDTHVSEITSLIQTERLNDVVLCGHSYGGMVVTGVADRVGSRIASIVYLDSFVPHDGDSVLSLAGWPVPDGPTVAPPPASQLGLRGKDALWVDSLTTPHPSGCVTQPIALQRAPAEGIPATYVLATDRASRIPHLLHAYERAAVTAGWTARTIHGSHELMIDSPDEVTAELLYAS